MRSLLETLERRAEERTVGRLPCELFIDGRRHEGIVCEVSGGGLLVQTGASPRPGSPARIRLLTPGGGTLAELEGAVTHQRAVPHRLSSLTSGTIGLRVWSSSGSTDWIATALKPS